MCKSCDGIPLVFNCKNVYGSVNISIEGSSKKGKEVVYEDFCDPFHEIMEDYEDGEEGDVMEDYEDGEEFDGEENVDVVDANSNGLNLKDPIFDDITIEDVLKMTFDTVDGANTLCNIYNRCLGFSVRRGNCRIDKHNILRYRK
ncbi:hypothetical protein M9H77_18567 [Catharanthus roseus]|uniref:Uncharacterized protein n=1 Tax=Catharanthus roseus TaxID=4058 RepID=A0ACC0B7T6_CATRO|nr:hypothetical protein M9H77_18567 [Catharanthus roseus]